MKHVAWTPILLLSAALAAGCASLPVRQDDTTAQELRDLKARVLELQRKAAVNEVELARLRQQVADLEAQLAGRGGGAAPGATAARRTTAPPAAPPASTVARPRAAAPPPAAARPRDTAAGEDPAADLPVRPQRVPEFEESDIEEPAPVPAAPPRRTEEPAAPARPAPAPPETAPQPAAQALYDRGYTLYHQGHYVDAEASFQRFLQGQPASELADNAQYWIGECRYARGDHRGALAAFRETVERYPQGNKVPDALLKAGQCLEALGDAEGARLTYGEVMKRFPGTAAATAAEERRAKVR